MEYKKLEEINKLLRTTDIKGKDYVEVNERLKAFWNLCENGKILTHLVSNENGMCVFKAEVYEDKNDEFPRATGTAYEKEGSTFINKTSYIENCETSAVGRALGNAGIGIDTSVASAEEVQNAIIQQDAEKKISKTQAEAFEHWLDTNYVSQETLDQVLKQFNYKNIFEIKQKDLKTITNKIQEKLKGE